MYYRYCVFFFLIIRLFNMDPRLNQIIFAFLYLFIYFALLLLLSTCGPIFYMANDLLEAGGVINHNVHTVPMQYKIVYCTIRVIHLSTATREIAMHTDTDTHKHKCHSHTDKP